MKRFKFLSRRNKILLGLALVLLVWFSYRQFFGKKSAAVTYQTAQAEVGTLIISLSASGSVSAANSASVTTSATGVVKNLYVQNGAMVKSGQAIAEIDLDEESKQKYAQASSSYQSAKNSVSSAQSSLYSLQSKLFSANRALINDAVARNLAADDPTYIMENADWLAAESAYKNQQSAISQAQSSLNSAWLSYRQSSPVIYAPISGTISGMWLQIGSVITGSTSSTDVGGTKIASVSTSAAPTVALNLTEIDAPKIKTGQKATVTLDAFADKTFVGKVVSVDRVGSVSSGVTTYPTVIALDFGNPDIYPNMSASATIILDSKTDVLLVPSSAVSTQNGTSTVQVMKSGQPEPVIVETGLSSDTQTEITSGLQAGDVVVTGTSTTTSPTTSTQNSPFSIFGGGRVGGGAGGAVRFRGD
jgi:macrolide-specific efflux system membrane fusion protein